MTGMGGMRGAILQRAMSDLLSTAAQALKAPDDIVKRSAEARAKATGSSVDDVLSAWAGGATLAATPDATPPPAPAASSEVPAAASPAVVAAPAEPAPVAASAIAVLEPEPEEIVEPAPLGDRIERSWKVGASSGLLVGFLVPIVSSMWLAGRAGTVGDPGAIRPVVEVVSGWVVVAYALLSAVAGGLVAAVSRGITGWYGPGMKLATRPLRSAAVGVVVGLVAGALVGSVIVGAGQASEAVEGVTVVPVLGGLLWSVLGWTACGALIGVLVEAFGVPVGVSGREADEAREVGSRLGGAVGLPLVVLLTVLLVVGPLGYLFISFPEWAPLLGILVSGSVLAFAGLSASRPGMRVSSSQLVVAVLGVGVVVVTLVAVFVARGTGAEAAGAAQEGAAGPQIVSVV